MAQWEDVNSKAIGHATYTASWTACKSDVHSQQRFFCLMEKGEVTVDQCHRGYTIGTDESGLQSLNPLYIRNVPDSKGRYCGQSGYGYVSFERFINAAARVNKGEAAEIFDDELPTGASTLLVTAILEAGRISLDEKREVELNYDAEGIVNIV